MSFRDADRGQALQIGAVLLLGALVLAFSLYQAVVVPDQNREVEFKHNQQVQGQLQDLRNALVSTLDGSNARSVSVDLGTQYPSRVVALNPGPPSGSLATVGTTNASVNATIANAAATGETGDFWTGENRTYTTGAMAYRPAYNEYAGAPTTWFEHSVLYNRFSDARLTLTGQRLVDGNRISLVTLNGSYYTSRSGSATVDVRPVSASPTAVSVTNASPTENVTLTVPTRLSADDWRDLLAGEFTPAGNVVRVSTTPLPDSEFRLLTVVLQRGESYRVQLARAGVGSGVVRPETAYLTDVAGNGTAVPEGGTAQLTVEVRDRFNNPITNDRVYAGTQRGGSSVSPTTATSDGDGQVTLTYEAPADVSGVSQATDRLNVSLNVSAAAVDDPDFDPESTRNVTLVLKVDNSDGSGLSTGGGGDGGAYAVDWLDPTQPGVTCDPANDPDGVCTLDANETASADLVVGTTPTAANATVEFAQNDTTVGSLSPGRDTTDTDGEARTTFTPSADGSVTIYGASGGSGDRLTLVVENVSAGNDTTAPSIASVGKPADGVYGQGDTLGFTVGYDEVVTVDESGGTPRLSLDIDGDGDDEPATYVSGSGSDTLTFEYAVQSGDEDSDGIAFASQSIQLSGGTITDAAGNAAETDFSGVAPDLSAITVDTTAPTISNFDAANPSGQDVRVSFNSSEPLSTVDVAISGAETGSLARGDFTQSGSGPYEYVGTYAGSSDGTYTATLNTAADGAGNDGASGQSDSVTVSTDTGGPTVTTATFNDTDNTINDSEANANAVRSVTLTFNETMDQSVTPTIAYENVSGGGNTYTVRSGQWLDSTTYEQVLAFADNDVDTPVTVEVSGAQDDAGNTMDTERPLQFTVDTVVPASPGGVRIDTRPINASNVGDVTATVTNPGSLDGDERAVLSIINSSTGTAGVTVEQPITTGPGGETTFTGVNTSALADGLVAARATIRDDAGNTGDSVTNDDTPKDTAVPSVSDFTLTNPSGSTLRVTLNVSEPLATISVDLDATNGTRLTTLTRSTLDNSDCSGGTCTYTWNYDPGEYGVYEATLLVAADDAGNDGAAGQSDAVESGPASLREDFEGAATLSANLNFSSPNAVEYVGIRADGEDGTGTVSKSPTHAAYVEGPDSGRNGAGILQSRALNTSDDGSVTVAYAVKQGDGAGSTPEEESNNANGEVEDLFVEYRDASGNWVLLDRFEANSTDGPYRTGSTTLSSADALHDAFTIRFRQPEATGEDSWHVDNVCLLPGGGNCAFSSAGAMDYNGDGAAGGPGGQQTGVSFSLTNNGPDPVRITEVAVDSNGPAGTLYEGNGAGGQWNHEVFFDATTNGFFESGDQNVNQNSYSLGSGAEPLNTQAVVDPGTTTTVSVYEFIEQAPGNSGGPVDMNGESVTVTLTYSDGTTDTITFTG